MAVSAACGIKNNRGISYGSCSASAIAL